MNRQPESILIVGAQKSGKTTRANEIIQSVKRKTIIVDSDGLEEIWQKYPIIPLDQIHRLKKGIARIIFDEDDPLFFRKIRNNFFGGCLVFDDAAFYLADRRAEHFRKILMKNRQTNNDVIWICHGLSEVPANFWTFFSLLVLFKTTDSWDRNKRNYSGVDVMAKRVEEVNRLALKNRFARKTYRLR